MTINSDGRMRLTKCQACEWKYPERLVNQLVGTHGIVGYLCGMCALEVSNDILGIDRVQFTNPVAESFRQDAINWRKNHPKYAPILN